MALTVRPFEDRDSDGFWKVRDLTYNNGQTTPPENRQDRITSDFVAEEDGQIMGAFSILDLTCTREDRANLKCAGIAGVAVAPMHRHLGVGSAMMAWAVPYMRSQGYHIASLYGFRESFYRKFGYEVCGKRLEIEVPSHRLPRIKPDLPVRLLDWQNYAPLKDCQAAFARKYTGMNVREDMHWKRVLNDKRVIYAVGDPVEAYAILTHNWEFWEPQLIGEIAYTTIRGYKSIIAVLSQICINKTSLKWYDTIDSPYLQTFTDQGVIAQDVRRVMYRLLDVPAAIEALSPTKGGAFSMEVKDDLIPENAGYWRVEDNGEKVACQRVDSADLCGDIQAWTVAYLGDPGIQRGVIEEREAGALAAAAKILTPSIAHCQEFF